MGVRLPGGGVRYQLHLLRRRYRCQRRQRRRFPARSLRRKQLRERSPSRTHSGRSRTTRTTRRRPSPSPAPTSAPARQRDAASTLENYVKLQPKDADALRQLATLYQRLATQSDQRAAALMNQGLGQSISTTAWSFPDGSGFLGAVGDNPIDQAVTARLSASATAASDETTQWLKKAVTAYDGLVKADPSNTTALIPARPGGGERGRERNCDQCLRALSRARPGRRVRRAQRRRELDNSTQGNHRRRHRLSATPQLDHLGLPGARRRRSRRAPRGSRAGSRRLRRRRQSGRDAGHRPRQRARALRRGGLRKLPHHRGGRAEAVGDRPESRRRLRASREQDFEESTFEQVVRYADRVPGHRLRHAARPRYGSRTPTTSPTSSRSAPGNRATTRSALRRLRGGEVTATDGEEIFASGLRQLPHAGRGRRQRARSGRTSTRQSPSLELAIDRVTNGQGAHARRSATSSRRSRSRPSPTTWSRAPGG